MRRAGYLRGHGWPLLSACFPRNTRPELQLFRITTAMAGHGRAAVPRPVPSSGLVPWPRRNRLGKQAAALGKTEALIGASRPHKFLHKKGRQSSRCRYIPGPSRKRAIVLNGAVIGLLDLEDGACIARIARPVVDGPVKQVAQFRCAAEARRRTRASSSSEVTFGSGP